MMRDDLEKSASALVSMMQARGWDEARLAQEIGCMRSTVEGWTSGQYRPQRRYARALHAIWPELSWPSRRRAGCVEQRIRDRSLKRRCLALEARLTAVEARLAEIEALHFDDDWPEAEED
jgi:hypothetical protein